MSATESQTEKPVPRMLEKFRQKVVPELHKEFGYPNVMMIPKLTKIVVNMGVGRAVENKARIEHAQRDMATITGQRPTVRVARKSVAGFKLREGYPVGCAVTLRP